MEDTEGQLCEAKTENVFVWIGRRPGERMEIQGHNVLSGAFFTVKKVLFSEIMYYTLSDK